MQLFYLKKYDSEYEEYTIRHAFSGKKITYDKKNLKRLIKTGKAVVLGVQLKPFGKIELESSRSTINSMRMVSDYLRTIGEAYFDVQKIDEHYCITNIHIDDGIEDADLYIPWGIEIIASNAGNGLENLNAVFCPASLRKIEQFAFSHSSITSISLNEGLRMIGDGAFNNCLSLSSISIPPSVVKMGHSIFSDCQQLCNVSLPDALQVIPEYSFLNCAKLSSVNLPSYLDEVKQSAFEHCISLKRMCFPSSLKIIGPQSFSFCYGLEEVSFPASIVKIEREAFYDCASLSNIIFYDSDFDMLKVIEEKAFFNCVMLNRFKITSPMCIIEKQSLGFVKRSKSVVKKQNMVIITHKNTSADKYAKENNLFISYIE